MTLEAHDVLGQRIEAIRELTQEELSFIFNDDAEIERPCYEIKLENDVTLFSSKDPSLHGNGILFVRRRGSVSTIKSLKDTEQFDTKLSDGAMG